MIKYQNDCLGCITECFNTCKFLKLQPHVYCDCCNDEIFDDVYYWENDGLHYCRDCIVEKFLDDCEQNGCKEDVNRLCEEE